MFGEFAGQSTASPIRVAISDFFWSARRYVANYKAKSSFKVAVHSLDCFHVAWERLFKVLWKLSNWEINIKSGAYHKIHETSNCWTIWCRWWKFSVFCVISTIIRENYRSGSESFKSSILSIFSVYDAWRSWYFLSWWWQTIWIPRNSLTGPRSSIFNISRLCFGVLQIASIISCNKEVFHLHDNNRDLGAIPRDVKTRFMCVASIL